MADAGEVLFEPIGMKAFGREFFGAAQIIFFIFLMYGCAGSSFVYGTLADTESVDLGEVTCSPGRLRSTR